MRKGKLWNDSMNCWRNGLDKPSRRSSLDGQARRKVTMIFKKDIDTITGLSFVSSVLPISTTVNGILGFVISG